MDICDGLETILAYGYIKVFILELTHSWRFLVPLEKLFVEIKTRDNPTEFLPERPRHIDEIPAQISFRYD